MIAALHRRRPQASASIACLAETASTMRNALRIQARAPRDRGSARVNSALAYRVLERRQPTNDGSQPTTAANQRRQPTNDGSQPTKESPMHQPFTTLDTADLTHVTGGGLSDLWNSAKQSLGNAKESFKKGTTDVLRGMIPSFPGRGQLGF
jgi:hypothetical protein